MTQITIGRLMMATALVAVPLAWLEMPAMLAITGLGLVVAVPAAMAPPGRRVEVASWASLAQPSVILAYLYATWIAAWCVLVHRPRPSLDDPKYISSNVDFLYDMFACSVTYGLPLCAVGGGLLALLCLERRNVWPLLALPVAWFVPFLILACEPFYILMWYMD